MLDRRAAEMAWWRSGTTPIIAPIGRFILRRSFPRRARTRILLAYRDDSLAYPQFIPFLRYADRFAADGIYFRAIPDREIDPDRLPPDLDALFLQTSYTPPAGELECLLAGLAQARPTLRIAFFDWFAPADIRFAERVDPWVSNYVKKSLLRDRSSYLLPTKGHTNLTDYFSERLRTDNPPCEWTVPPTILGKLVVGPSFSTSAELIRIFERDRLPKQKPRPIDLHARIATRGSSWYGAMRSEAANAVSANFPDLNVASHGWVSKKAYMQELRQSKACFSPFGYGEVCWRDFEAVAAGAVLVKPDMSHIETNPDIYRPFETYVPVRWDLADLGERVRAILGDPMEARRITERAFAAVRDHLRGTALTDLAKRLAGIGTDAGAGGEAAS